jgi:hypothetical protein
MYIVNLKLYQDEDYEFPLTLQTKDAQGVETVYDLTGKTLEWTINKKVQLQSFTVFTATSNAPSTPSRVVVTDANDGQFKLVLNHDDLADIPTGSYTHVLMCVQSNGRKTAIFRGGVIIQGA